jgi:hypothetical protein
MVMKTMDNYKLQVSAMFAVLADGSRLPTYMILSHKTLPKGQLPSRISEMNLKVECPMNFKRIGWQCCGTEGQRSS